MSKVTPVKQTPDQEGDASQLTSPKSLEKMEPVEGMYDPFASPPDWEKAKKHARANRVAHLEKEDVEADICDDCGLTANNRQIPICGSRMDLVDLGAGFPLYYEYIFFVGILLCFLFVLVGINGLVQNHKGTACSYFAYTGLACAQGFINQYSLGHISPADKPLIQEILSLVFVVLGLGLAYYYRRIQGLTADEVNRGATTPSDYTIMVRGIPADQTALQVQEFFEKKGRHYQTTTVKKVSMAYNISIFIKLMKEKTVLLGKKAKGEQDKLIDDELKKIEDKLDDFEQAVQNKSSTHFTGTAFVTFNTEQEAKEVAEMFKLSIIEQLGFYSFKSILSLCGFSFQRTYNGSILKVQRAPEPFDIIWENLGYKGWEVVKHRLVTGFFSLVLIGCSFGAVLGVNYGQKALKTYVQTGSVGYVVSLAGSIIITIINNMLIIFVRLLVKYEKHRTQTSYYTIVANRLSYSQFINTAIITLVVQKVTQGSIKFWAADTLVPQIFFLFILTAGVTPALRLFNVGYFIKLFKQYSAKGNKNSKMTQHQANKLFEGPQLDMAFSYTSVQKLVLFTGFYATMVPIGVIISVVGLILTYWVDRYLLLRRYARPFALGKEIAEEMSDFLELFFVAFSAGNLVFQKIIYDEIRPITLATLIFSCVILVLPQDLLAKLIIKRDEETSNSKTYDEAKFYFITEYDRVNPVTQEDAMKSWLESLIPPSASTEEAPSSAKEQDTSAQALKPQADPQTRSLLQNLPRRNLFDNMTNYMNAQPMLQHINKYNPRVHLPTNMEKQATGKDFRRMPTYGQYNTNAQRNNYAPQVNQLNLLKQLNNNNNGAVNLNFQSFMNIMVPQPHHHVPRNQAMQSNHYAPNQFGQQPYNGQRGPQQQFPQNNIGTQAHLNQHVPGNNNPMMQPQVQPRQQPNGLVMQMNGQFNGNQQPPNLMMLGNNNNGHHNSSGNFNPGMQMNQGNPQMMPGGMMMNPQNPQMHPQMHPQMQHGMQQAQYNHNQNMAMNGPGGMMNQMNNMGNGMMGQPQQHNNQYGNRGW